jgi:hypothetical protein
MNSEVVSKLSPYKAKRSLAKVNLEEGLRLVNDFYWSIFVSTQFASEQGNTDPLIAFVNSKREFGGQGRLRPVNLRRLIASSEDELPKFGLIVLFSHFEVYLREVCMTAVTANPGVVAGAPGSVNGENIAGDEELLSVIESMAASTVDGWLRGNYAERFGAMRRVFGLGQHITAPHVPTLDEYYAKRNCFVHRRGMIDARSKRFFPSDDSNPLGGKLRFDRSDFIRLHRAIHSCSDEIDTFTMNTHVRNAEVLRRLYEARRDHSDWTAKNYNVELQNLRLDIVSRRTIAQVLGILPK